ncbi:hypothetical protein F401_gp10 [Aeromonas phage phiAS7]|uniref:Uncharacterized protein n=1 Tax=Aeromonas phage phiAS7 TaxID=1141132 RepID=H6UK17_9CAUD|nr:hypothetical protein F401_gp10 [Aeromonas phage phiAS7]AEZ65035.1 hypothetical protein phiAS7_00010 [Aeromonas phage phiAS7]
MNTSLVHTRTAHLPPEEQAKGNYVYTSPEELSRLATLRRAEEQRLSGENLSPTGRTPVDPVQQAIHGAAVKVVRKRQEPEMVGYDLSKLEAKLAAVMLTLCPDNVLALMSDDAKLKAFNILAEQLGYVVE